MAVTCVGKDGTGLVTLTGPLTADNAEQFRQQFNTWLKGEADIGDVVVDLGEVDFIDSAGLGVLMALLKRVSEGGGDLKIAKLQKKARVVFEITRAHRVFEIFDGVDQALDACR